MTDAYMHKSTLRPSDSHSPINLASRAGGRRGRASGAPMQADTRSWRFQELQFCGEREVHCIAAYCSTLLLAEPGPARSCGDFGGALHRQGEERGRGKFIPSLTVCVPRLMHPSCYMIQDNPMTSRQMCASVLATMSGPWILTFTLFTLLAR